MASSDDECEPVPQAVSNYYFVDEADELISFSKLPVQWDISEKLDSGKKQIFLHGTADGGLQKVYKQAIAWKFNLSGLNPEISVVSKEINWIKLEKPRKSYEDTVKTILFTVQCLHILKKDPETSGSTLLDRLSKDFSFYQIRTSEDVLMHHKTLINEAVKRYQVLAKSKFLGSFQEERLRKREALDEEDGTAAESEFLNDGDIIDETEEDGSDQEGELFDSVCAICDNGGELMCCEGRCLRSFHATADAGADSMCESLGLSDKQVEEIQNFICQNCESKQHQCFSCGELGSSDKSLGTEVFACVSATCGRFYHPDCVSNLVHRHNLAKAKELQTKIAAGEPFTCPVHKCCKCKEGENKMDLNLQFAVCRRCPKSYHRKCLPRKIAFEDKEDEGITQRAWEGLLPNRILIYCLDHKIDDDVGTPPRNHIKFPKLGQKKRKQQASDLLSRVEKNESKERSTEKVVKRQKCNEKLNSGIEMGYFSTKRGQISLSPKGFKKQKVADTTPKKSNTSAANESEDFWGQRLNTYLDKRKDGNAVSKHKGTETFMPVAKDLNSMIPLDDVSKKKISNIMKDVASSITLEEIIKKHKMPSTHPYSSRNMTDKGITLGKVERSIEAIRAALKKLEEGRCSLEDAVAVCEPELVEQIFRWQSKFKVYLAPFLDGMSYTSFGRHFTRVEKLKEIADMVRWYVEDGDMVVDFCCGANDFSCLMKKRTDEMGTKCSYKNYDIMQAKYDFNFEARDWMSVRPRELKAGSQLVMGLHPPLGVTPSLANKFIDKALEFKPKLLILILPQEIERLDKKKKGPQYDLIWEDSELLSGKSFYIPGSVDVKDKQIDQWESNPPPLCLWSRADWTDKHKGIAQQHGHISRLQSDPDVTENLSAIPVKGHELRDEDPTTVCDIPVQHEESERPTLVIGSSEKVPPCENGETKGRNSNVDEKDQQRLDSKFHKGKQKSQSNGRSNRSDSNDRGDKYENDGGNAFALIRHNGELEPDSLCQRSNSYLARYDPRSCSPAEDLPHSRTSTSVVQRHDTRMVQTDLLAFAPSLDLPFAEGNSSGWLDE